MKITKKQAYNIVWEWQERNDMHFSTQASWLESSLVCHIVRGINEILARIPPKSRKNGGKRKK